MTEEIVTEEIVNDGTPNDEAVESTSNPELARARAEHTLEQQLEALLLVADEPISAVGLATAADRPVREVRRAVEVLITDYDGGNLSLIHI